LKLRRIWKAIDGTIRFADSLLEKEGVKLDEAISSSFEMFEFGRDIRRYLPHANEKSCIMQSAITHGRPRYHISIDDL
jgi:hypothetical protein